MLEFHYSYMITIGIVLVILLAILAFLPWNKHREYTKGRKVVAPEYLVQSRAYKARLFWYKFLKIMSLVACLGSIFAGCVLLARPYHTETRVEEQYGRDIILCMDISTSVDYLNEELVDELKYIVEDLSGERFGIVIFNTTPVVLCPLTTDYEYVLQVLDHVGRALHRRNDYWSFGSDDEYEDSWIGLNDYISSGTIVGNEYRGSSLIGDGLASAVYNFTDLEDLDRTRIIIFSSDNDLQGNPLVTLPEAGKVCEDYNVVVYGIGTEFMYTQDMQEMRQVVEHTGGKFYIEEQSGSVRRIVQDIDTHGKNLMQSTQYLVQKERPGLPFFFLLVGVSCFIVFLKISKR